MSKVTITQSHIAEFGNIKQKPDYIELGNLIGKGGFGEVYECKSINGVEPPQGLVVKLLFMNTEQQQKLAELGYHTIQKLQQCLSAKQQEKGIDLFKEYPALRGIPTCCFEGRKDSQMVRGHISVNLTELGMIDFEKFTGPDHITALQKMPLNNRLHLSLQLVKAFEILQEISFVHADLKESAFFIDAQAGNIAIIDYDSGTVSENMKDDTTTTGTPISSWLAPEVVLLQNSAPIRVDKYCDRWSIMVAVCIILSGGHHPLAFIDGGKEPLKRYRKNHEWPNISPALTQECFFSMTYPADQHEQIMDLFRELPKEIYDLIEFTINFAGTTPGKRAEFSKWVDAITKNINSQYKPVKISTTPSVASYAFDKINKKKVIRWGILVASIIMIAAGAAYCYKNIGIFQNFRKQEGITLPVIANSYLLIPGEYRLVPIINGNTGTQMYAQITEKSNGIFIAEIINESRSAPYILEIDEHGILRSQELGIGEITENKFNEIIISFTDSNNNVWKFIRSKRK